MIQALKLDEEGYRGARFDAWNREVRGNNDLLNLSRPRRHPRHSSRLFPRRRRHRLDQHVLLDRDRASRLRHGGHRLRAQSGRRAAGARSRGRRRGRGRPPPLRRRRLRPDQPHRLDLAGRAAIPASAPSPSTNCARLTASRSSGLLDGGVDLLLIETIFDTLNAKAAIYAIAEACDARGIDVPVMISGTITDRSGRLLSGQTPEAFWNSVRHANPVTIGLNCALGAKEMRAHIAELGARRRHLGLRLSECRPAQRVRLLRREPGLHGGAARRVRRRRPGQYRRRLLRHHARPHRAPSPRRSPASRRARFPSVPRQLRLSGLEAFTLTPEIPFVNVGERTNVTGSAQIPQADHRRRLCRRARDRARPGRERRADDRRQHGRGPARLRKPPWSTFLNLIAAEPDIARVPVMVDSSKFSVIEAGLKCLQGKAVVNSISMKEGEAAFIEHAKIVRRHGAAVVVMAFDEKGQADTLRAQDRDQQTRLRHSDQAGRLSARGHHLRPQYLRHRHRHGGAQRLRRRLHRGGALDQGEPAARARLRRRVEPVVLVPRQ